MAGASRTDANIFPTDYAFKLVEELYPGSPRWRNPDAAGKHAEEAEPRTARVPVVAARIRDAWDVGARTFADELSKHGQGWGTLHTCVNPACAQRTQWVDSLSSFDPTKRRFCHTCRKRMRTQVFRPIREKWIYVLAASGGGSPELAQELYADADGGFWSFMDDGSGVHPTFAADAAAFHPVAARRPLPLRDVDDAETVYQFFLSPVPLFGEALDRLLSLAAQAPAPEQAAADLPDEAPTRAAAMDPGDPRHEQLKWGVVQRRFTAIPVVEPDTPTESLLELVAVADPFARARSDCSKDYMPVKDARQLMATHPDEKAKRSIATSLRALLGLRKAEVFEATLEEIQSELRVLRTNSGDPAHIGQLEELESKVREDLLEQREDEPGELQDQHDLRDDMNDDASALARLGVDNWAAAWIDRFEKTFAFLETEVDAACARLVAWLDSEAHRIVEQGCQLESVDPDPLTRGILHYAQVLQPLPASNRGRGFLVYLVTDPEARKRIPFANVLMAQRAEAGSAVQRRYGDVAVLALLPLLALLARADHGEPALGEPLDHLRSLLGDDKVIEVPPESRSPGLKFARDVVYRVIDEVDKGVSWLNERKWAEVKNSPPPKLEWKPVIAGRWELRDVEFADDVETFFRSATFMENLSRDASYAWEQVKAFKDVAKELTSFVDLLMSARIYFEQDDGEYKSSQQRFKETVDKVKWPVKAAAFGLDLWKKHLADEAAKAFGADLASVTTRATPGAVHRLGTILSAVGETPERTAQIMAERTGMITRFRRVDIGGKVISGPAMLVFGSIELVMHDRKWMDAWKRGDWGAMTGSALLASSAVLGVTSSIVITVALLAEIGVIGSQTAVALWAAASLPALGPIGVAAAVISIVATLWLTYGQLSDLEEFASHCFLGDHYGEGGDPDKPWAEFGSWSDWSRRQDRFQRQNRYLHNLISNVEVELRPSAWKYGGKICIVHPPPGSCLEVKVTGYYEEGTSFVTELDIDLESGSVLGSGLKVRGKPCSVAPTDRGMVCWVELEQIVHGLKPDERYDYTIGRNRISRPRWDLEARLRTPDGHHVPPPKGAKENWVKVTTDEYYEKLVGLVPTCFLLLRKDSNGRTVRI